MHEGFTFYFERFYNPYFQEYILLLAACFIPFCIIRSKFKKLVLALLSGATAFLSFISFPPVKLDWYDAPAYPLVCAALALVIWELATKGLRTHRAWRYPAWAVLALVVIITVKNSLIHVGRELDDEGRSDYAYQVIPDALKIFHDRYPGIRSFDVLVPPTSKQIAHHLDALTFYKTAYQVDEKKKVKISDMPSAFGAGDTIICNQEILSQVQAAYHTIVLDSTKAGVVWVILESEKVMAQQ